MGACLSLSSAGDSIYYRSTSFALVVSNKGELRQYPSPIFVSEVLAEFEKPRVYFLCNSDSLYLDQHIPALDSEDELDAGQIYFILPKTMLGRRLSAPDMAALAVKASVALDSNNSTSTSHNNYVKKKNNNNNARISPMVLMEASQVNVLVEEEEDDYKINSHYYSKQQQQQQQRRQNGGLRVSRSGSIRKIMPSSSSKKSRRRRLAAVTSFRLRLSTIYENEGCIDNI
uniref:uncharacterized protein LOC122603620 n=1 Tax=Erigeron canadensis TaxID=72917 RepID=UPI001CB9CE4C|nr:uncharacterized protein LOC122603620 [Erigeron canadensis]